MLLSVAGLGGLLHGVDIAIIVGALPCPEATSGLTALRFGLYYAASERQGFNPFKSRRAYCTIVLDGAGRELNYDFIHLAGADEELGPVKVAPVQKLTPSQAAREQIRMRIEARSVTVTTGDCRGGQE